MPRSEILAGSCKALTNRVTGLLKRIGVEEDFMISGGIAKNMGVVSRLERKFDLEPKICFEPQIVGALGAAVFGRELIQKRAGKRRRSRRRKRTKE